MIGIPYQKCQEEILKTNPVIQPVLMVSIVSYPLLIWQCYHQMVSNHKWNGCEQELAQWPALDIHVKWTMKVIKPCPIPWSEIKVISDQCFWFKSACLLSLTWTTTQNWTSHSLGYNDIIFDCQAGNWTWHIDHCHKLAEIGYCLASEMLTSCHKYIVFGLLV